MVFFVPLSAVANDKPEEKTTPVLIAINHMVVLVPHPKGGTMIYTTSGEAYHVAETTEAIHKLGNSYGHFKVIGG